MTTKNKILLAIGGALAACAFALYSLFKASPTEETEDLLEQIAEADADISMLQKDLKASQAQAARSPVLETEVKRLTGLLEQQQHAKT